MQSLVVTLWHCRLYLRIIKNDTEHWIPGLPASERNITDSAKKNIFFGEIALRLTEFSQLGKYLTKQIRKISNLQDLENQFLDIRSKSSPSTKLRFMQK